MDTTAVPNPDAFTNVEAQDFAFELRSRGSKVVDETSNRKGRSLKAGHRYLGAVPFPQQSSHQPMSEVPVRISG